MSLPSPTFVNAYVMTASSITVTVPTSINGCRPVRAVATATGNFYARFSGGAAATPMANITDGTASVLNPSTFKVTPGQTFTVIGTGGVIVTIAYYAE